jgi:hypothetical protein
LGEHVKTLAKLIGVALLMAGLAVCAWAFFHARLRLVFNPVASMSSRQLGTPDGQTSHETSENISRTDKNSSF